MPAPPVLDIEPLLQPIPGDDPAGDPSLYIGKLRAELREIVNPVGPPPEKKRLPTKKEDWEKAAKRAQKVLVTESKDLRVTCHLLDSLVRTDGFVGLRDGL